MQKSCKRWPLTYFTMRNAVPRELSSAEVAFSATAFIMPQVVIVVRARVLCGLRQCGDEEVTHIRGWEEIIIIMATLRWYS